jgi:Rrf2 family transcriptional regulator, iron-sulfur cluster assembly transcription factor
MADRQRSPDGEVETGQVTVEILNRSTETALVAMSRLAEQYAADGHPLTAAQIAEDRNVSKPFVAKVLTVLSQRGLVQGNPGRRGGYSLAVPPAEITLLDIARCFERLDRPSPCPLGPGRCGTGSNCPLHDGLSTIQNQIRSFLSGTALDVFT